MKKYRIENFTKGWFIGDFEPSLIKTKYFEIAIKIYKKGDKEDAHLHKIADEFTIITQGSCKMYDQVFKSGDIVWIEKGDVTSFEALEDCTTTVIKIPSVMGDKYIV